MEGVEKVFKLTINSIPHDAVIGACFYRINSEGKQEVLLVQDSSKKWYFPGGKAREGESLDTCLRRELREELDVGFDGTFEAYNIDSYEISQKKLAIANVTARGHLIGTPRVTGSDAVINFAWTSEPLNYDLTEQARVVLANQMSNTMLPKPEK